MKQNFYIFAVLITLFIILGCQSGSSSFPSSIYIPSNSVNITGEISDNNGTPISEVKVILIPSGRTVFSDISGKYEIPAPADTQKITFLKKDYLYSESIFNPQTIIYNKSMVNGTSNFTGTIYEENTTLAVTNANIQISSISNHLNVYSAVSDINGNFSFSSIPSEDYNINITADNYSGHSGTLTSTQIDSGISTYYLTPIINKRIYCIREYNAVRHKQCSLRSNC